MLTNLRQPASDRNKEILWPRIPLRKALEGKVQNSHLFPTTLKNLSQFSFPSTYFSNLPKEASKRFLMSSKPWAPGTCPKVGKVDLESQEEVPTAWVALEGHSLEFIDGAKYRVGSRE